MNFLRQQAHFKKRIPLNWRKPKGHHSKLREKRRGMHKMPGIGFGKKHHEVISIVHNINELSNFKKGDKIIISSSVGNKKRLVMLEYCVKRGIIVNNYGKRINDKIKAIKKTITPKKKKVIKEVKELINKEEVKEPEPKKRVVVKKKKVIIKKSDGDAQ